MIISNFSNSINSSILFGTNTSFGVVAFKSLFTTGFSFTVTFTIVYLITSFSRFNNSRNYDKTWPGHLHTKAALK